VLDAFQWEICSSPCLQTLLVFAVKEGYAHKPAQRSGAGKTLSSAQQHTKARSKRRDPIRIGYPIGTSYPIGLDIQQQHNTHLRCVALAAPAEEVHRPTHATSTMTHPQAV